MVIGMCLRDEFPFLLLHPIGGTCQVGVVVVALPVAVALLFYFHLS